MSGGYRHSVSPFDVSHHVALGGTGAHWGMGYGFGETGGNVKNPRPWNRSIAAWDNHECRINRNNEVWDAIDGRELWYVGKAKSEREAVEIWRLFITETFGQQVDSRDVRRLPGAD